MDAAYPDFTKNVFPMVHQAIRDGKLERLRELERDLQVKKSEVSLSLKAVQTAIAEQEGKAKNYDEAATCSDTMSKIVIDQSITYQ